MPPAITGGIFLIYQGRHCEEAQLPKQSERKFGCKQKYQLIN